MGEETNLLFAYLATVSRKAERPFGVVVQSSSAAGKSTVADAVAAFVPEEDLVSLSALTGQAPVSYTHLDVYKRQALEGCRLRAMLTHYNKCCHMSTQSWPRTRASPDRRPRSGPTRRPGCARRSSAR